MNNLDEAQLLIRAVLSTVAGGRADQLRKALELIQKSE